MNAGWSPSGASVAHVGQIDQIDHDIDNLDHDLDQIDHDIDHIDKSVDQVDHDLDHVDPNLLLWVVEMLCRICIVQI